jgi:hypothetical protein
MQKVIHYNPKLQHQVDHAQAFQRCGFEASSTPECEADVHVISGNWFAYNRWKHHPRTLMIDRAYWGDPEYVSIGWLQPDGSRKFACGDKPRHSPQMMPWKSREVSCIVLADYDQDISEIATQASSRFASVQIRRHPSEGVAHQGKLTDWLKLRDVCIFSSGTAGFEAVRLGVPSICLDPRNPIAPVCANAMDAELYRGDRNTWLHELSYKQWSLAEIASGEAWEHLKDII